MHISRDVTYVILNSEKDYIVVKRAHSNQLIAVVFHVVVLTKNRIGSAYVARNNAFMSANLMHEHIFIVESTRAQFLIRLSKYCA